MRRPKPPALRLEALEDRAVPAVFGEPWLDGRHLTLSFAPAGTPPAIVNRLNQELNAVLKDPEIRAKLQEQGAVPGSGSAEELGQFVRTEYARNQKIVQSANIKE